MPKLRTVCLSNAFPPDSRCGAFAAASFSTIENLARSREWVLRRFCGKFDGAEASEDFSPILSRIDGDSADAKLWRGYRMLSSNSVTTAEKVATMARRGNAFLILNPTGLSTQEWMLALAQAQTAIPWVDSDWPQNYPACDPFWTLALKHRHSLSPATLIASALIRSLYGEVRPHPENFCCVRAAIFATENLRERNAAAFPNLERSAVIPPPVDPKLFPFEETSPERTCVWGWNGSFSENSGILVALDTFARHAFSNPQMHMLLAGNADSGEAEKLRSRIQAVPGLAQRISFVGEIPRERLAQDFFRRIGLYVFIPKDETAFPLEAAEAMACGCLVFASMTDELRNLVSPDTPTLFNARAPETARMMSDLVVRMSPEEWALTAADGAARVQERFAPARVEAALAEFLESAAVFPPSEPAPQE
ncbi:MAG: glycosyltransferase family 4 protein [Opitutales bacterium]|nr:glycosyltransferase family 4 protein [Opitutales bacterium]